MFSKILERIVTETGGGIDAVLMGYDGIAVDQFCVPGEKADLQLVAIEYANVLKEMRKTTEILDIGDLEEVAIKTERYQVVVRIITPEYFVALTLRRDGNFGKARYLLNREAGNLRVALS
jgi:predicted regulator of Ras-like GTPase activity (Roadblock/LC7/MglB family)